MGSLRAKGTWKMMSISALLVFSASKLMFAQI